MKQIRIIKKNDERLRKSFSPGTAAERRFKTRETTEIVENWATNLRHRKEIEVRRARSFEEEIE